MNEMTMRNMLSQVDFSKGTDLKERLHRQLFAANNVSAFPIRRVLSDDDLELVNAAAIDAKQKTPSIFNDRDQE